MRNSLATPLIACFILSHIEYSHVSYVEMNHKLEIDIETKIQCISSPRFIFQQSVALKAICSQQMSLTYGKGSAVFGNSWSIYIQDQVK